MALYYNDIATMETGSSFCALVDLAVMLYEQEYSKGNTNNTFSEEDDKRIFLRFPRKSRNTFVTCPRRNLNTILVDSHTRHLPQSPSPSSSTSQSSLLPKEYKVVTDSETLNQQNPNSSSLSLLDSEKMTNPNSQSSPSSCVTENTSRLSRKRRAAKQRNPSNGKSKKAKLGLSFTWQGKETPEWLVQLMEDIEGTDLKLIFERDLYQTDVNPGESRLSMPFNHLIRNDFLTTVESRIIEQDINNDNKTGVGAILVDHMSRKYGVMLKRWEMKKDTGSGSWNYSLTCGWNDVVKANQLKKSDYVSVWSFRWRQVLCFALVPAPME